MFNKRPKQPGESHVHQSFPQVIVIVIITLISSPITWAAGLNLYEQGTPDTGTANAGRFALARDASTASSNPAGMTRLDRSQMLVGFAGLLLDAKFDVDAATYGGGNGGNAGDFIPAGSFSYVHNISPDFKLGFTVGSYFGLGLDYDNDWAGRYYVQEAELMTAVINPGAGYRINEWLSVGAGFSVMNAELKQKVAVNNGITDPGTSDGRLKLEDDDTGYGYNLGILFEPWESTRFGLTYRSEIELQFEDLASLRGLGANLSRLLSLTGVTGSKIDMEMTVPQAVMFSAYHEFTNQWAVMANVGWQDYSAFGKSDITVSSDTTNSFTRDLNYDDTYHVAFGVHYRITPPWLLSAGIAYDSSPTDRKNRTPDLPLDRQVRYAVGAQYELCPGVEIGCSYEFIDAGSATINQPGDPLNGTLQGDYRTNRIQVFSLNIAQRF